MSVQRCLSMFPVMLAVMFALTPGSAPGQQPTPAPVPAQQPAGTPAGPLAYVATEGVSVTGSLMVANGRASMGNNSGVTAGERTAEVTLARGGTLRICATTSVHLSKDALPPGGSTVDNAGLMLALDRGAVEASYTTGKYSDVLLTPDLRILISGPGKADLKVRVNRQGDTCVDNHGNNGPYVTVSSLMDGGVYRVQPNQRVLFEHGSLQQVVDRETEPCGCPDRAPAATDATPAVAEKPAGGPSSTAADTAFPLSVSEGLAPPPGGPTTPVVPPGQAHAQVTASISNDTPPGPPPPAPAAPQARPDSGQVPGPVSGPAAGPAHRSLLRRISGAIARLFHGGQG